MKRAAPRRTCLGCRQVRPQPELIRLVRGPDGCVRMQGSGSDGAGRGAYACPTIECLTAALRKGRLDHAFRLPTKAPESSPGEILIRWAAGGNAGTKETSIGGTAEGH